MADPTQKRLLNPKEIDQVRKMAGMGMNISQMGAVLGVSKSTMERRQNDQPELAEAIEKGRAEASLAVRSSAFKMATSGKSPAMTIFWLKVRDQWREAGVENADININLSYNLDGDDDDDEIAG